MVALALLLLLPGSGFIAMYIHNPAGKGDMWIVPLVGGMFALVGVLGLFAGIRGARGLKVPLPQVFIEREARLVPGATARIRLRQPGPMNIESLKLRICCERVYERQVKPGSSTTVEDRETLWEQVPVEVRDCSVSAGGVLERETVVTLPPDAHATGPARPDGQVRWRIEVWGEAGFLRATYRAFDIRVSAADAAADAALPAAQ